MDNDTAAPALVDLAGLIPTLAPAGNITGPFCRVGVTIDNQVAVLAIGGGRAGFDLAGLDVLRATLDAARVLMTTDSTTEWTPPADAARTHAGDLKHVCNGPDGRPLPFGRLAPEGECARCDERRHGAPARPDHAMHRRTPASAAQDRESRKLHRANCTACQTGGVCTAFDW